jgi:hypothetical protein
MVEFVLLCFALAVYVAIRFAQDRLLHGRDRRRS